MNLEKKLKLRSKAVTNLFLFLACQIISIVPSFCTQPLIDIGLSEKNLKVAVLCSIALVISPFISVFLSVLISYRNVIFSKKKSIDVSSEIFSIIIKQKVDYFDDKKSTELATLCSKEVSGFIYFVISEKPRLIAYIISSIVILIMISLRYWTIGLFLLLYIPLSMIPEKRFVKKIQPEIEFTVNNNALLNQKKAETFQNIEYLKINVLCDAKKREIEDISKNGLIHWAKISIYDSLCSFWNSGFLPALFLAVGLTMGILFNFISVPGQFPSIGAFASLLTYIVLYCHQINSISGLDYNSKKHSSEIKNIESFLELDSSSTTKAPFLGIENAISFKNVSFSYNKNKMILSNVSFDIRKGLWTCIVGPSGIGKSTILSLLLKLRSPVCGEIEIDGRNLESIEEESYRTKIAYVQQTPYFYSGTILYNFSFFTNDIVRIEKALATFNLSEFIASLPFGLNSDIGEAAKRMSGGEKQRLALAIQYTRNCDIWVLDEITAHLDNENRKNILTSIKSLRESGKTIIMVTHKDDELVYSDEIINLK